MRTVIRAVSALAGVCALAMPVAASANVTLLTTLSDDAAFEGAGGYLQTVFGLPLVDGTALPPLERAVGQVKTGVNKREGLYVPTAASGLPAPVGSGVTTALTNFGAIGGGADTNFVSGTSVGFSFARVGNTVTYSVGADSWADTQSYYSQIDAVEVRIRSNVPTAGTPTNAHSITGLSFTDAVTASQALGDVSAADGAVAIKLWSGVSGDFRLTGNYLFNWTGAQPTGSRLASQIKLLDLPAAAAVPEPATWALMIVGFGLVGLGQRRRNARRAVC